MAAVQIYLGRDTNTHKGNVDSLGQITFGDWWITDSRFNFLEAGVSRGSIIRNVSTGSTANVTSSAGSDEVRFDSDIFSSIGDRYEVTVGYGIVGDVKYTEIDLFDDEPIEMTQNVKDFKDVSKVLSDYTQQFKVPASKINNKVFDYYYNADVINGFDARFRVDSVIKLNGVDWKEGQMRLDGVGMSNGKPEFYKITFFGLVSSLKNLLGEDTINQLEYLDIFDHSLTYENAKNGLFKGWDVEFDSEENPTGLQLQGYNGSGDSFTDTRDLIYPLISAKNRYYVDGGDNQSDIDSNRNLYKPSGQEDSYHSLYYEDLKPSIKIYHIFRGIEKKYGIKFSQDFIPRITSKTESVNISSPLYTLYMHCTGKKGYISNTVKDSTVSFRLSDLTLSSGNDVREDSDTSIRPYYDKDFLGRVRRIRYDYSVSVNVVGGDGGKISIEDKSSGKVYIVKDFYGNGTQNISFSFTSSGGKFELREPVLVLSTATGATSVSINSLSIYRDSTRPETSSDTGIYTSTSQSFSQDNNFRNLFVPRMKCIDFIKGIFNMYNLVGFVKDGEIIVKPLNDYLSEGKEVDISKYVDYSNSAVDRPEIYREISYSFKKPTSLFMKTSNETTQDEYGNERWKSGTEKSFDGGKLEVKIDFGKMIYEQFYDIQSELFFKANWGYNVNDSSSPSIEKNLLHSVGVDSFFINISGQTTKDFYITDGSTTESPHSTYFAPSNYIETDPLAPTTPFYNYNFGDEVFNDEQINENSLFNNYHRDEVLRIYDENSRKISVKAYLPSGVLSNTEVRDIIIINGKPHRVNNIKSNLLNGKTEFELLRV